MVLYDRKSYEKMTTMNIVSKIRIASAAAAVALMAAACVKEPSVPYKEIESRSLEKWIEKYHPELTENYQEEGGYYVEVLDEGTADSLAIADILADSEQGECWVTFDLTGRNLQGDVFITRSEQTARMQGTFTRFTHYVPYRRYIGTKNISMLEGTYLAMKNTLKIGSGELQMRHGTKVRLYLPSSVAGGNGGLSGDGGYEGEFSLDGNRPAIIEMEITDRINNPVAFEGDLVDAFGEANGGVTPVREDDAEASSAARFARRATRGDGEEQNDEDDGNMWRHACDTIPGLLVTKNWVPRADAGFEYAFPYLRGSEEKPYPAVNAVYADSGVYGDMQELDKRINEVLIERFGEGSDDGDEVGTSGTAKIWFIGRFLDGFIFDTNIAEVRSIIYGTSEASGSAFSYSPENNKSSNISVWYYAIPEMRYGQWASIVTTSSFAYGSSGVSGTTDQTTTGGSSYAFMPMYNMYNGMYGSSMYDYYSYDYYNYNLLNYYNSFSSDTTTTTTISTEIQAFTPLLYQIFIEKKS